MRSLIIPVLLLTAATSFAQSPDRDIAQVPLDARTSNLDSDLRALGRIATLAKEPADNRQVMLAIVDSELETLREKRDDGTFRWAALQREEASRVEDEKSIERVQTEKELRNVAVSAPNAYRLLVTVPTKRNLISANNRVFVRNVLVDSTGFDGKTTHTEIPVNAWVNPGDSNGVALPEIGRSVKATAELGVESGDKKAVAQVALLQAKLVDTPQSPYFPAVRRLLAIRELVAQHDIKRGALKDAIDEAVLSMPGELQKRAAERDATLASRREMAVNGTSTGSISAGDATPDVISALHGITHLLGGTLDDQVSARHQLDELIAKLQPAAMH
jgi:hypothetical protein